MKRLGRVAEVGVLTIAALVLGKVGVAFQRTQQPIPLTSSDPSAKTTIHSPFDLDPYAHEMEEKRGKAMNSERQKAIIKEANQLMQATAELEAGETSGMTREEQAKRAETIEKLAKDVKERMRGTR